MTVQNIGSRGGGVPGGEECRRTSCRPVQVSKNFDTCMMTATLEQDPMLNSMVRSGLPALTN